MMAWESQLFVLVTTRWLCMWAYKLISENLGCKGMFKLLQGCKAKPCGSPGPGVVVPSAPDHDRDNNTFRNGRTYAFFILPWLFSSSQIFKLLLKTFAKEKYNPLRRYEVFEKAFSFFFTRQLSPSFQNSVLLVQNYTDSEKTFSSFFSSCKLN